MRVEHWPVVKSNRDGYDDRKDRTWRVLQGLVAAQQSVKILDIGGCEFKDRAAAAGYQYTSIDLQQPQSTGTGGHQQHTSMTYDGKVLPFEEDSFDVVLVGFVFHHAAENTLPLLKQISKIATQYVIIGEDISEVEYPMKWHQRNHEHQPGGVYRSTGEWEMLFTLFGIPATDMYVVHRADDDDGERVYRCVYVCPRIH